MKQGGSPQDTASPSVAKKLIFWDFARASWQYDVVVALILIFIFAMPRAWFQDQPRAANVTLISSTSAEDEIFLEPSLLANLSEQERVGRAAELIRRKTGKKPKVLRLETIRDKPDAEIKGFIAYTTHQN
jgi:hypothetical protein